MKRLIVILFIYILPWQITPAFAASDDCAKHLVKSLGPLSLSHSLPLPILRRIIKSNNSSDAPDSLEFYNVSRGLQAYFYELHINFRTSLMALRNGDVYLDLGGGNAGATSDYLTKDSISTWDYLRGTEVWPLPPGNDRAQAISISVDLAPSVTVDKKELLESGRLTIYKTSLHQYAKAYPASANVISEMRGAIIYSIYDTAVVDMISLLKPGGKGYFVGSFAHITDANEKDISPLEYLKMGTGFSVIEASGPNERGVFEVTRTSGVISLPQLKYLKARMTEQGPESWYRIIPKKWVTP